MPGYADFQVFRYQDGILTVSLEPPAPIGAWNILFEAVNHFGGSNSVVSKSVGPGFNGLSGILITDSGHGVMNISVSALDVSGLEYGNYAYQVRRVDSGAGLLINEGYMQNEP